MWYDNFKVDGEGWLPASGRGNYGGHALCGFGLAKRGTTWGIRTRNSWNVTWGGSSNGDVDAGDCIIPDEQPNN